MNGAHCADWLWYDQGALARATRLALRPAELLYAASVRARAALYDTGALRADAPSVPALGIGNLTVGGTGKTPFAAWAARRLADAGAHPAIVLRGYGDDEPLVHRALNPTVPVVVDADRLAGIRCAVGLGANVVVLDDAFQHRRVRPTADVVLVSADRWSAGRARLLPAGPWREPLAALARCSLVVITRKAATSSQAARVTAAVARVAPAVPRAVVHLALNGLHRVDGDASGVDARLAGARMLVIAAIGDSASFFRQLEDAGVRVRARAYRDHHRYTSEDAAALADALEPSELPVCTLKDAVKLAPLWPRGAPPIWYVSQRLHVEEGSESLDALLSRVLSARPLTSGPATIAAAEAFET